jgi:hypothetical protein
MPAKSLKDELLDNGLALDEILDYISWMVEVVSAPRTAEVAAQPAIERHKRRAIERACADYTRAIPA